VNYIKLRLCTLQINRCNNSQA